MKAPKDALELLCEANNVAVVNVVSGVVRGAELLFDYPVFGDDANDADVQDNEEVSEA